VIDTNILLQMPKLPEARPVIVTPDKTEEKIEVLVQ
jgi:hypothetical protein